MIVGSGLIARTFAQLPAGKLSDVCIYAAGVSNSSCQDPREFERERERLEQAMTGVPARQRLVYFSTCSIEDPEARANAYVRHKAAMEELVQQRAEHLILRLPQLGGFSPNPHTLLNYLFARIARAERFQAWTLAHRNIIDVDDAARIALELIAEERASGETINIANAGSSSIGEIIHTMEDVLGRRAIFDSIERGGSYPVDILRIQPALRQCGISFPPTYLHAVISKYYGPQVRQHS